MKEIDCRGLNCPEPVLRTKSALSEKPAEGLTIMVDNQTARDNVLRFINSSGSKANWQEKEGVYYITLKDYKETDVKSTEMNSTTPASANDSFENPVLLISTDQLGVGSSELGRMLMRNFIFTLTKRDELPLAIILMNSGVKLSIKDSPVIEELDELHNKGVQILACGTCLDYFELKDLHKAGQISNMYDISDLLLTSGRVVTI